MSRTPIRDVPFNQPRCRLSTGETCRIVDRWSMAERENVARGLVPRWGRGGGVAESAAPIRCTRPQLRLFIPWRAGTSRHERLLCQTASQPLIRRFSGEKLALVWYHVSKNKHARIERRRSTHLFLQNKLLHTRGWSGRNRKTCFCKTNSYAHEGGVGAIEKPVFAKQLASQALGQTTISRSLIDDAFVIKVQIRLSRIAR